MPSTRFPVVDLSLSDDECVATVREACRDLGFFQVIHHGLPDELLDAARSGAERFFALPTLEKNGFPLDLGDGTLSGYAALGAESSDVANLSLTGSGEASKKVDLMESFQFQGATAARVPAELAGPLPPLYDAMRALGDRLLTIAARAAGVAENPRLFADAHVGGAGEHRTVLRVTRYPSLASVRAGGAVVPSAGDGEVSRIAPHRDLGTLTLLFQDDCGGLEVQDPRGGGDAEWVPVPPVSGAAVINVGNLLTRWTNGVFRSSIHRVLANEGAEHTDRMSVIMFENPRNDATVGPLENFVAEVGERKYEDVQVGAYLSCKLKQLFDPDARENKGKCKYDD